MPQTQAVDLQAYFERIGSSGPHSPTLETLQRLHALHPAAIPFENLDALLGRPVLLDVAALQRKLVTGGRGGYCFEQNGLFAAVLETLGFRVTRLAARVVRGAPPGAPPGPRTHMLLGVDLDDERFIADVGFGGLTLTAALRLTADIEQSTPHEPFRLLRSGDCFDLEAKLGAQWEKLYRFTLEPQLPVDYEVANWFVATQPESIFLRTLRLARAAPEARYALLNNALSIYHRDGRIERRTLASGSDLAAVLAREFRIRLPEPATDLDALLERIAHNA